MSSKFRRVHSTPQLSSCGIVESDCAFLARFVRGPGDSEYPAPPESQTRAIADTAAQSNTEQSDVTPPRPQVQRRRAKSAR
jgi:hypothetical protein